MTTKNLETWTERNDIVEKEMKDRFNLDSKVTERGEHGMKDLMSELPSQKWIKYSESDIQEAAGKRIDTIVKRKWVSMGNLSIEENERMKKLVDNVKKGLNGKPAQMIEQFAEMRDWIMGTLSTSDGKSEKDKNNLLTSQKELENKDSANEDWRESLQKLREFIQKKIEQQQMLASSIAREACKMWDQTYWKWNENTKNSADRNLDRGLGSCLP
jgi:hypothetical protein